MKEGFLLEILNQELNKLPLYLNSPDLWNSVKIDYENPLIERIYMKFAERKITLALHVIHPCDEGEEFFHPHPWPSAIYLASGHYEMKIGCSKGIETPEVLSTIILNEGSYYEMINPDFWHTVRPLDGPTFSIMVSGEVWDRKIPETPYHRFNHLSEKRVSEILRNFRILFGEEVVTP